LPPLFLISINLYSKHPRETSQNAPYRPFFHTFIRAHALFNVLTQDSFSIIKYPASSCECNTPTDLAPIVPVKSDAY